MNSPDSAQEAQVRATLRERTVQSLKEYLQQADYPRLQMTMMVTLTCLSGFIASWLLMNLGLAHLGWRYGVAVLAAYGAFLGMLRVWLHFEGRRLQLGSPDAEDAVDAVDVGSDLLDDGLPSFRGGAQLPFLPQSPQAPLHAGGGSSGGGGFSFDLDGDELVVVVLVIAALAALAAAAGYLIYQAPSIFADLMFDGVLSAGLYRRLKNVRAADEAGEWLPTALKRTAWPFAIVGALVVAAGFAMHGYAPEARSIGGVYAHFEGRDAGASEP
ncbi:MAG: hypothetical protein IPL96_12020 [Holophagaceae bacterium]|nr:hypothetical protein [Holophagaceae bacterium]